MKHFIKKYKFIILFALTFSGICLFYNFHEIFQYGPRSFHQWRQSDSASIAFNYFQDGFNFFKPRVHYVMGGEGYVAGAGEAPIFYYLVAILYNIFGPHEGIFRLLSLLILLAGFYWLSKIILEQTNDIVSTLAFPAIMMSSPLIAYYSFNFTPNIPAQGISMIGIWFFYLFYKKERLKDFYFSLSLFTLAGLIKISALIMFLVIFGLWFVELLNLQKFKNGQKLFKNNLKIIPAFLTVFVIIFLWKSFADHYNDIHQTNYFLSKIRPIWSIDVAGREIIWNKIIEMRLPSYFTPITFWICCGLGLFILFTPRKHKPILYFTLLFTTLGCVSFFLLMFKQFEQHDYYALEMMILPIVIFGISILYLNKSFPNVLKNQWFRFILGMLIFFNILHTKSHLNSIYSQNNFYMSHFNASFYKKDALQTFIGNLGIQSTDKIISAPDLSPNNSLYYLNLKGWTEYFMGSELNPLVMKFFMSSGANYLIINDKNYLEIENLKPFLNYPLGDFENSIFVFDIRPYKLKEQKIPSAN